MVFDVWVDGDQLPRKIKLTTPPGSKLTMDTTMTYSNFNEPVSITAPPASEVTDGSKLGATRTPRPDGLSANVATVRDRPRSPSDGEPIWRYARASA